MNRASTGTPGGPRPVHGALPILSISSLMMVAPGAILMRPLGILPALAAAVAVVIALRSPRPEARPLQLGRRGAQWVGASSALEGIVAVGGVLLCLVADQMQWWFPLLLASVALHLTTFLIWARRRIDLLLVPIAWTSAGLAIGGPSPSSPFSLCALLRAPRRLGDAPATHARPRCCNSRSDTSTIRLRRST